MEIKNFLKHNIYTKNIYSYLSNTKKKYLKDLERKKIFRVNLVLSTDLTIRINYV